MNYIYWLSQIQYSEQSLVGDKLFILSQLLQDRCPIFPGFVLGNSLLREFLNSLDEPLIKNFSRLDINNYRTLQSTVRHSRQLIEDALFPQAWQTEIFSAARELNSACLSLEPFITTPGASDRVNSLLKSHTCTATPQAIAEAIKLVWSELFTANSLFYWHKLGLNINHIDLAILIRPLINVYASGTVKIERDSLEIEANWGLEASLLRGDVEPDRYDLDRHTGDVRAQYLGLKNYAYRPTDLTTATECLEAYIPDEKLASTYVLDSDAIALLFELLQNAIEQQPQIKHIAWTAIKDTSQPQFYLTRFSNYSTTVTTTKMTASTVSSIQPLLNGVPVSPGYLQAEVVVFDTDRNSIPQGAILVTKAIAPQHLALIKRAGGIITETGGKTSHGAIIARELHIPAIVNVPDATKVLQTGDRVLLDGDSGNVYPATAQLELPELRSDRQTPAYPIATKLMVNLSQPESIASVSSLRVDGVGLLRSELMLADLLSDPTFAWWQESFQKQFVTTLTNSLRQFTTAFAPRPVFYRSLDRYAQSNSVLGSRGTYDYLSDPTLFDLELQALATITAEGQHNLNLILPFVRSVEEFQFCDRRIENAGLTTRSSFQVWIMAEVPATILLLPEYIRAGVRGIAIGTNDLTQLLLGVDREQTQFSDRGLNANHPAMHKAMAKLIKTANEGEIECSICGQAPVEYPSLIEKLIEWGITTISVEPDAVDRTYRAIARAERRILLKSPPKQ